MCMYRLHQIPPQGTALYGRPGKHIGEIYLKKKKCVQQNQ